MIDFSSIGSNPVMLVRAGVLLTFIITAISILAISKIDTYIKPIGAHINDLIIANILYYIGGFYHKIGAPQIIYLVWVFLSFLIFSRQSTGGETQIGVAAKIIALIILSLPLLLLYWGSFFG